MTKDMLAICAVVLAVGLGAWSYSGHPHTRPHRTQVVRNLADDPAQQLVSETSSYMRTERYPCRTLQGRCAWMRLRPRFMKRLPPVWARLVGTDGRP